ncbi:MAG: hypothetical protein QM755_08030 [Luteolibacter sp.]
MTLTKARHVLPVLWCAATALAHAEIEGTFTTHGMSAVRANGWPNLTGGPLGYLDDTPMMVEVRDESGDPVEGARVFVDRGSFRCEFVRSTDYIGYALVLHSWKSCSSKFQFASQAASTCYTVIATGYRPLTVPGSHTIPPGPDTLKGSIPLLAVKLQPQEGAQPKPLPKKIR